MADLSSRFCVNHLGIIITSKMHFLRIREAIECCFNALRKYGHDLREPPSRYTGLKPSAFPQNGALDPEHAAGYLTLNHTPERPTLTNWSTFAYRKDRGARLKHLLLGNQRLFARTPRG